MLPASRTPFVGLLAAGLLLAASGAQAGGDADQAFRKGSRGMVPIQHAQRVQSAPPLVQVSHCPYTDPYSWHLCYNVTGIRKLAPHEMVMTEQVYAVYCGNGAITTAPLVYVPRRHPETVVQEPRPVQRFCQP